MRSHPKSAVIVALTLGSAVVGTSTNYSTSPQVIDAGGLHAASTNYTASGSVGGVAGVSTATSPDAIAKQGYAAQLYEICGVAVAATPATINEGESPNNPLAAPTADSDGDGQNNLLEYLVGTMPNDSTSHFSLRIEEVPGSPQQKSLVFGPLAVGRSYTVLSSTNLSAATPWQVLAGGSIVNNSNTRTVTDPAATDASRFYRVKITLL